MPLPVRYIDSNEYLKDGTLESHLDAASPQIVVTIPILEKASSSLKLQALSVHNLTDVIRQLGSLAKHAESVLGDVVDVLASYQYRTGHLEERCKRLSAHVLTSLDADREGECCMLSMQG